MTTKTWLSLVLAAALAAPAAGLAVAPSSTAAPRLPQRDYLTQTEADKIRDAYDANDRIKLFLDFAADRLRRFRHEVHMTGTGPRRADFLNDILNAFIACVDEASGRIDDAIHHGEDVRKGIKEMRKRAPELMAELKKIKAEGLDLKLYQDSLDDAMSDLKDAIKDAKQAEKRLELNPPRRQPHSGARR